MTFRMVIRLIVAMAIAPAVFLFLVPLFAFIDWLQADEGATKELIGDWADWAFMRVKG